MCTHVVVPLCSLPLHALCCAVLCCALLCRAVPCCAVMCCAVLCRAVRRTTTVVGLGSTSRFTSTMTTRSAEEASTCTCWRRAAWPSSWRGRGTTTVRSTRQHTAHSKRHTAHSARHTASSHLTSQSQSQHRTAQHLDAPDLSVHRNLSLVVLCCAAQCSTCSWLAPRWRRSGRGSSCRWIDTDCSP